MISKIELRMIFNWILIDKFAIGTPIILKNEKALLKKKGIKTVLDLRNSDDLNLINQQKYIKKLCGFAYENFPLPDHKSGRLAETFEIRQAVDLLHSSLSKGPVFMHCKASIERSPLICMGWLMKNHSLNSQEALDYLMEIHPGTNPLPQKFNVLTNIKF